LDDENMTAEFRQVTTAIIHDADHDHLITHYYDYLNKNKAEIN